MSTLQDRLKEFKKEFEFGARRTTRRMRQSRRRIERQQNLRHPEFKSQC